MKSVTWITSIVFYAITALLMAACGGGGGDGGDDAVPTAPASGVSITAGNAELVSADVLGTVGIFEDFLLDGGVLPAVQVEATGSDFKYTEFVVQQLQQLSAQGISSNDATVSGIVISASPVSYDCAISGTRTIYGDVAVGAPEWIPTLNDQITMRFNNCVDLEGVVMNGTMSMTITALDGDFVNAVPPYDLGVDVVLTVFSIQAGGQVASADGDMSMLFHYEGFGYETLEVSGASLTAWSGGEVETLTGYRYYHTLNSALPEPVYTYEMEGKLASTVIGGTVSFQMIKPGSTNPSVPFEGVDAGDPYTGELWITTSADASGVHITAQQDSETLLLDRYADINGAIVEVIMTTWKALGCLLDREACLIQ